MIQRVFIAPVSGPAVVTEKSIAHYVADLNRVLRGER